MFLHHLFKDLAGDAFGVVVVVIIVVFSFCHLASVSEQITCVDLKG